MKRFYLFLVLLTGALVCSVPAFAQEASQLPEYGFGFETFAALVAIIPVVVEFFKQMFFSNASGLVKQIISWVLGVLVTAVGWFLGLGFLAGMEWWMMLLYGIGASLAANGVFNIGLITWALELLGIKQKDGDEGK